MAVPQHLLGVTGDECQCGRRASVRHCPFCGSSRIYGYVPQFVRQPDNTFKELKLFRCMSCGGRFEDWEREHCDAPPISRALAQQKVRALSEASKTGEYLNPNDKEAAKAINELLVETHKELTDNELRKLDFSFRTMWVNQRMQAKQNGQKLSDENVYDFVIRMLKEHNYGEAVIQRTKEMHERDKSNEQSNSSTVGS